MSRQYRPCDLHEALRCQHCGTRADELPAPPAMHRLDERLTWLCDCDREAISPPLPAEYGEFVHELDETVIRGELAAWMRRHEPTFGHSDTGQGVPASSSAAPGDVNADRLSTVRLRPFNGVSSLDVLRRLIRWGGRVKVDFDEVALTLTGPDDLVLTARRDLTDHRLVHRTPLR